MKESILLQGDGIQANYSIFAALTAAVGVAVLSEPGKGADRKARSARTGNWNIVDRRHTMGGALPLLGAFLAYEVPQISGMRGSAGCSRRCCASRDVVPADQRGGPARGDLPLRADRAAMRSPLISGEDSNSGAPARLWNPATLGVYTAARFDPGNQPTAWRSAAAAVQPYGRGQLRRRNPCEGPADRETRAAF